MTSAAGSPTTSSSEPLCPASTGRPAAMASTTAKPNCSRQVARGALASTNTSLRTEQRGHLGVGHAAEQAHALAHPEPGGHLAQPTLERAAAHERELRVDAAVAQQPQRHHEVLDPLLGHQPAHAHDPQRSGVRAPLRGREALEVDAHRKHLDALRRHARELEVQPGVRADCDAGVEPCGHGAGPAGHQRVGRGRQRDVLPHRRHHAHGRRRRGGRGSPAASRGWPARPRERCRSRAARARARRGSRGCRRSAARRLGPAWAAGAAGRPVSGSRRTSMPPSSGWIEAREPNAFDSRDRLEVDELPGVQVRSADEGDAHDGETP